jgi:spermidine/putrescine transport system ATP-binding protein
MSDKLIIMDEGNIRQMGTPRQVYEYPKNRFVAEFVGERNIIECEFSSITDGKILVNYAGIEMEASPNIYENKDETRILQKGDKVLATVHADKIIVTREKLHAPSIYGTVIQSSYTGAVTKTEIETKAGLIKQSEYGGDAVYKKGEKVYISWDGENCLIINE